MKILDFIFASRPLLHLPIWSIFIVSNSTFEFRSGEHFSLNKILILSAINLIAAGAFYLNQVYDYETDLINKKLGFLQRKFLTRTELIVGAVICFICGGIAAFLVSSFHFALIFVFILFAVLYSVPPFKLKDRVIPGLLSNAITFGYLIPFALVTTYETELNLLIESKLPLYFFLTVSAIHIMTTVCDIDGDHKTNKKTVASKLGKGNSILTALVILLASCYIAYTIEIYWLQIVSVLSSISLVVSLIISTPALINVATKLPILLLTILAGYYQPIYLMFIVVLIIVNRIYFKKRFSVIYPKLN